MKRFGAVSPLARIITLPGGWRLVCEVVKEPVDVPFGKKLRLVDTGRLYPLDKNAGEVTVIFNRSRSNLRLQVELESLK